MTTVESGSFIQCKQCHSQLPTDAVFCGYCGQSLESEGTQWSEKLCSYCGKQVRTESAFCGYCGLEIESETQCEVVADCDELRSLEVPEFASLGASSTHGTGIGSIIIGLAAVLLVGLIAAGVVYTRHQKNPLSNSASAQIPTASDACPTATTVEDSNQRL